MSGHLRYSLDVFAPGVQTTTGTVSFTIGSSQIASVPQMGGQRVLPLEGRVESIPWSVDIVDASSFFTKKLSSTASGRMNLLGRLVRFKSALNSTASSAYQTLQVGRLSDVNLNIQDQTYRVTFSDERFVERETEIFTAANNVALIPAGPVNGFLDRPPLVPGNWYVKKIINNLVLLELQGPVPPVNSSKILQLIVNDVKDSAIGGRTTITVGNFRTLRFRNTGTSTDYEVGQFDTIIQTSGSILPAISIVDFMRQVGLGKPPFDMWVVWPTSQPTVGTIVKGYLYMPTHEPTPDLPFLLGGTVSGFGAQSGKHPFKVLKEIYDGTYSATTSLKVRYSTAAIDKLTGNAQYGAMWFRASRSWNMADFVEQRIYQPYGVVPLIDTQGRVAPTAMTLPQSTAVSLATLVTLGSSNISGHPTFEHPSREVVTAIMAGWETYNPFFGPKFGEFATLNQFPPDLVSVSTGVQRATSTNIGTLGRRELRVAFPAVIGNIFGQTSNGTPNSVAALTTALAREVFDRFQDGPIWAKVPCLATIDQTTLGTVTQGQFVKLNVATFPNPVAPVASRGGVRIMQVMTREEQPTGPILELLDAGPNLAATSAPTLTLALSTQSSRHAIVGTVASLAAGARWTAFLARTSSTGASAPAANSTKWQIAGTGTTASLSFTRGQLASKTRYYGRALAKQPLRIRSNYSASTFKVTASIAMPTTLKSTGITGGAATVKWQVGSSLYPLQVMVDASTSATLGSSRVVASLAPQTTRYQLTALNLNTKHKWGVRHYDTFGGFSAIATATVQTTTSYGTAPTPAGIVVLRSL